MQLNTKLESSIDIIQRYELLHESFDGLEYISINMNLILLTSMNCGSILIKMLPTSSDLTSKTV